MSRLLDPGYNLTLRPMLYPRFYEMYRAAIKNTWSVEEIELDPPKATMLIVIRFIFS